MNRFFPILILLAAMLSCARMPALGPPPPQMAPDIRESCALAFPDGNWQIVHAIETTMAGRRGMFIGVSVISARSRAIRCALMSIEGLVMFEARDLNGKITIDRAVPPFDSPNFARGMLEDIRMIFFQPGPRPDDIGLTPSGSPVCRYKTGPEQTVDVEIHPRGGWTLHRYEGAALVRTVTAGPPKERIPRQMQLTAHGPRSYTLDLNLLEAIPLGEAPLPED